MCSNRCESGGKMLFEEEPLCWTSVSNQTFFDWSFRFLTDLIFNFFFKLRICMFAQLSCMFMPQINVTRWSSVSVRRTSTLWNSPDFCWGIKHDYYLFESEQAWKSISVFTLNSTETFVILLQHSTLVLLGSSSNTSSSDSLTQQRSRPEMDSLLLIAIKQTCPELVIISTWVLSLSCSAETWFLSETLFFFRNQQMEKKAEGQQLLMF